MNQPLHQGVFGVLGARGSGAMRLAKREAHKVERMQKPWRGSCQRTACLASEKGAPLTVYGGGRLFVN
jgi:hypothetical protein